MPVSGRTELEGTTLRIYAYVAKSHKPVGVRDIMKDAHVASASLTYKHLQRLENLGLIEKGDYGNYVLKQKTTVKGYHWIGHRLLPRMMLYGFLFAAVLIAEVMVVAVHFGVETHEFKVFFLLIGLVTGVAALMFMIEGLRVLRKTQQTKE